MVNRKRDQQVIVRMTTDEKADLKAAAEAEGESVQDFLMKPSRAISLVQKAIRDGQLTRQPCEICGSTKDVDARPLDVRWLCRSHHRLWHSEHGRGANAADESKSQLNVSIDEDVIAASRARAAELGQPIGVFVERALSRMLSETDWDGPPLPMAGGARVPVGFGESPAPARREFRPDPKPTKKP